MIELIEIVKKQQEQIKELYAMVARLTEMIDKLAAK